MVWGASALPLRAALSFRLWPLPLYSTPGQVTLTLTGSLPEETTSALGVQAEKLSMSLLKS